MTKNSLTPAEWEEMQATLPRGCHVKGRVASVHPFGVFVDIGLGPRIPVLLEIIHFKIREDEPQQLPVGLSGQHHSSGTFESRWLSEVPVAKRDASWI
jgi:hypothetical protein